MSCMREDQFRVVGFCVRWSVLLRENGRYYKVSAQKVAGFRHAAFPQGSRIALLTLALLFLATKECLRQVVFFARTRTGTTIEDW